jgi:hypothetical protein
MKQSHWARGLDELLANACIHLTIRPGKEEGYLSARAEEIILFTPKRGAVLQVIHDASVEDRLITNCKTQAQASWRRPLVPAEMAVLQELRQRMGECVCGEAQMYRTGRGEGKGQGGAAALIAPRRQLPYPRHICPRAQF